MIGESLDTLEELGIDFGRGWLYPPSRSVARRPDRRGPGPATLGLSRLAARKAVEIDILLF
ncbi:MAG: hypothetical protein GY937_11270 [bacterium]|nr:hypothetical protein [bacterium]